MSNAVLSDRIMTLFNEGRWDEWQAELASDATMEDMALGSKSVGSDEVLAYAKNWKTMYPDMVGTCENRIEAGDVLVEECSWTGTNTGPIAMPDGNTIPPTGNTVNIRNLMIWEYENGKVKSVKNYLDLMTMMSQLGLAG